MNSIRKGRGRSAATLAVLAALALGLAACGDNGDAEGEAISGAVADAILGENPERTCTELLTPELVDEIYGGQEQCIAAETPRPDDGEKPDEVVVSDIDVNGETASARVTEDGGETHGATGTVELTKDGEAWKISGIGIDYLRSILSAGFESGEFTEEDGPLYDASFRECLDEELQALDDDTFRQMAYDGMADREITGDFQEAFLTCSSQSDDGPGAVTDASGSGEGASDAGPRATSFIRKKFEEGVRESIVQGDGLSPAVGDCIIDEIRETVTDEEIIDEVRQQEQGGEPTPELVAKVAQAVASCSEGV